MGIRLQSESSPDGLSPVLVADAAEFADAAAHDVAGIAVRRDGAVHVYMMNLAEAIAIIRLLEAAVARVQASEAVELDV